MHNRCDIICSSFNLDDLFKFSVSDMPEDELEKTVNEVIRNIFGLDLSKATKEQKLRAYNQAVNYLEFTQSQQSIEFFIDRFVKIEDKDAVGSVIPFTLWDSQKTTLKHFLTEKFVQVLKANQLGLTWLIIAYACWKLIHNPGYSVKVISDTELKAKEIIRRMDFILRHMPHWFVTDQKRATSIWYETTVLTITFHHPKTKDGKQREDSDIQAFASSPTAGAGFTANLFLFDEWALQSFAREIWSYAFPTINRPTGGQVIGISTIERGSLFEEIWKDENNDFKKIFLGWSSDPRRDQKWYEQTLRNLGLDETRKHYPSTVEEAFSIPGGAYFDKFNPSIHVRDPLPMIPQWYSRYRFMDYGMDMLACYFAYVDGYGYTRIYREIHESGLIISAAAYKILKSCGAQMPDTLERWESLAPEDRRAIALTATEKFVATFAPPDLFGMSGQTGKTSDQVWYENGITLTKVKNKFEQGCLAVTQWLQPLLTKDEQTGQEYYTARLTIDKDRFDPQRSCAPNLVNSLLNIQKDKLRPEVYDDKHPHTISHGPAALRYYCSEVVAVPINKEEEEHQRMLRLYDTPYPSQLENEGGYDPDLIF